MAVPFYAALREKYPFSRIYLLGNPVTNGIYRHSQLIDRFLDNPLDPFLSPIGTGAPVNLKQLMEGISELVKRLVSEQFDLLYNLQVLPMTAVLAGLSGARECTGMTVAGDGMPVIYGNIWAPYLFGVSASLMRPYNRLHRTEILLRMLGTHETPTIRPIAFIAPESIREMQAYLDDRGIKDNDFLVGLTPLANSPVKMWKNFEQLIKVMADRYDARIILFGSPQEDQAISELMAGAGTPAIKATHFNMNHLMAAITGCDLFISNDTGPMHLASLLDRKIIALFGPTTLLEVGPWSSAHIALQSKHCNSCYKVHCEVKPNCMDHISVEDVICAVDFLLNGDQQSRSRLSPDVMWHTSGDGASFSGEVEDFIAHNYLGYLENTVTGAGKKERTAPERNKPSPHPEGVLRFCMSFKKQIEEVLALLDNRGPAHMLIKANRHIATQCGFLKNIIVFNDMKFLDKRRSIVQDPQAYRMYYKGILSDMESFIA
jgi:ADP-heptose:LPS heptosyltransferase